MGQLGRIAESGNRVVATAEKEDRRREGRGFYQWLCSRKKHKQKFSCDDTTGRYPRLVSEAREHGGTASVMEGLAVMYLTLQCRMGNLFRPALSIQRAQHYLRHKCIYTKMRLNKIEFRDRCF